MKTLLLSLSLFAISMASLGQSPEESSIVKLTLRNTTAKSIPLVIPGVMNPNLSPFSSSGVNVRVGQKFYYYPKGKKMMVKKALLFEATPNMNGDTLVVNELIKERQKGTED